MCVERNTTALNNGYYILRSDYEHLLIVRERNEAVYHLWPGNRKKKLYREELIIRYPITSWREKENLSFYFFRINSLFSAGE